MTYVARLVHMILMTANPWKHPDSGFYWFRRRSLTISVRLSANERNELASERDSRQKPRDGMLLNPLKLNNGGRICGVALKTWAGKTQCS